MSDCIQKTPEAKLDLVNESEMPRQLDEAIRRLLCRCFPPDVEVFSRTRHWHGSAPDYSLVRQENGDILGHVGVVIRGIFWGGRRIAVAGIQNLAVTPEHRGTGLGPRLMIESMDEAQRRGLKYGLLFCVSALEKFYGSLNWVTLPVSATMRDGEDRGVPIPGKNICMGLRLGPDPLPSGNIDLGGPDW